MMKLLEQSMEIFVKRSINYSKRTQSITADDLFLRDIKNQNQTTKNIDYAKNSYPRRT